MLISTDGAVQYPRWTPIPAPMLIIFFDFLVYPLLFKQLSEHCGDKPEQDPPTFVDQNTDQSSRRPIVRLFLHDPLSI
jgi:hypothetical protein